MNRRSFFMGLGLGLLLAGVISALSSFGGRWHMGPGAAYRGPVETAPADSGPAAGYRADGHFGGGTYGWRGHHHFWGFPFMLFACFFPLIPLFFFGMMMKRRRHWHHGWHHGHHNHGHYQAQPPIV